MPKAPAGSKPKNTEIKIPATVHQEAPKASFGDMDSVEEFAKVLYYGPEGTGKTTGALTMAKFGKVLLVNAEGGAKRRRLQQLGIPTENVAVWPSRNGEVVTIGGLQSVYNRVKADLVNDPNSWFGVVFDSDTEITQALLSQVSDTRIGRARNKGAEILEVDEFFTDVADYGIMAKAFTDMIRKFRDLPLHVVHTALERRDVDKQTTEVTIGPAVSPSVAIPLLGYVDFVLAMKAEDDDNPFRARTKKGGRYRAKDRDGVLPVTMAFPTMERIIGYLNGSLVEAEDLDQLLIKEPKTGKKVKATPKAELATTEEK